MGLDNGRGGRWFPCFRLWLYAWSPDWQFAAMEFAVRNRADGFSGPRKPKRQARGPNTRFSTLFVIAPRNVAGSSKPASGRSAVGRKMSERQALG
jgi:hypothetical protein